MRRGFLAVITLAFVACVACGGGVRASNGASNGPSPAPQEGGGATIEDPIAAACESGIARSCLSAGETAARAGNSAEARKFYAKGCALDQPIGCLYAGQLWAEAEPVDLGRSLELFRRGCNLGEGTACYGGGLVAAGIFGGEPQMEVAAELQKKGCEANLADSCTSYAQMLLTGSGVEENRERAYELLNAACSAEEGSACIVIGRLAQERGDPEDAAKFYDMACDYGDGQGCTLLAAIGEGDTSKQELFERGCAADVPDPTACTYAAMPTFNSDRPEEAVAVFEQTCEFDDATGCFMLAVALRAGRGIEADQEAAAAALRRACELDPDRCDYFESQLSEQPEK